jgi:hypothetical protein
MVRRVYRQHRIVLCGGGRDHMLFVVVCSDAYEELEATDTTDL